MSVKVMERVWTHSQHENGELLVLLALADFANDDGECWPALGKLAAKVRLGERRLCVILNNLEAAGEIRRERSRGGRNRRTRYFVVLRPRNTELENSVVENSVVESQETLSCSAEALNRHRTVNKKSGSSTLSVFSSTVEKTVRAINDLAGKSYHPDSPTTSKELLARLKAGTSEADCLLVVNDRWRRWNSKSDMLEHFNPVTLFRKSNFEKYLVEAQSANGNAAGETPKNIRDLGNGTYDVDGRIFDRRTFESRYGKQHT